MNLQGHQYFPSSILLFISLSSGLQLDSGCGNEQLLSDKTPMNKTLIAQTGYDVTDGWIPLISHPGYGSVIMPLKTCTWTILPVADKYIALRLIDMRNLLCHNSLSIFITVDTDNKQVNSLSKTLQFFYV